MNAKLDMWTWKEIVQQCQSRSFGSINVASKVRSDAIIAADELVGLVTPELAALLERLGNDAEDKPYRYRAVLDTETARALAARIREALEADK